MLNLAPIFTGIILVVGLAVVMPSYYKSYYEPQSDEEEKSSIVTMSAEDNPEPKRTNSSAGDSSSTKSAKDSINIILVFSINSNNSLPGWCNGLSSTLKKYNVNDGIVFISGKLAESYPKCVTLFSSNDGIDIGSSTYNYMNLTSTQDYLVSLEQVKEGKRAVDSIAELDTKLFKAPYGSTDQNIYSLLTRSGILADFSYTQQYNVYENGQFIRYDLETYKGSVDPVRILNTISSNNMDDVNLIDFDNSIPVTQIDEFIFKLKKTDENIRFISGSELTGLRLNAQR